MEEYESYLRRQGFNKAEDGFWQYKKGCMDFYLYHFENPEGPRADIPTSKKGICPQLDKLLEKR